MSNDKLREALEDGLDVVRSERGRRWKGTVGLCEALGEWAVRAEAALADSATDDCPNCGFSFKRLLKSEGQAGRGESRPLKEAIAELKATADAPPEPTEKMIAAGVRAAEKYRDGARNVFVVHLHVLVFFRDVIAAALAAAPKEG